MKHTERKNDYFLFTDKSVAVVGNAQHLFERQYGSEIDSHDVVIRINRAAMLYTAFDSAASHGCKTTAWCVWRYNEYENTKVKEPMLTAQMAWFEEPPQKNDVLVVDNSELLEYTTPHIPSTGLMVLNWISKFLTKQVSVYGFDWKQTPTFTHNTDSPDVTIHNFQKEKELCENLYSHFNFRK